MIKRAIINIINSTIIVTATTVVFTIGIAKMMRTVVKTIRKLTVVEMVKINRLEIKTKNLLLTEIWVNP